MGGYTKNLQLYKVDTVEDGNDTFNINRMLNDNWDKIDEMLKKLPVQNGGLYINSETTEEDKAEAQRALTNLGYPFKTYLGLTEIGLENGSETIEDIANALPQSSMLMAEINASSNLSIYPTLNTGEALLVVTKKRDNRLKFELIPMMRANEPSKIYYGVYMKHILGGQVGLSTEILTATSHSQVER